jgi:LysM repeat protein
LVIPLELAPSKTPESGTISPVGTAPAGRTHKVKPGESLSVIAAEYGVSVRSLAEANNLADPSLVRAGKVLVIPEE